MNVLDTTVERCFIRLCEAAATPFSYKMLRHLRDKEWVKLCASAPDPRTYTDARTYQADAVIGNFFKKYSDFDLGTDLEAKAKESFFSSEASCYHSNERLAPFIHRAVKACDEGVLDFVDLVRKKVSLILGRVPNNLEGKFGPGSTFGDIGMYTTLPDKMSSYPSITQDATLIMPFWRETAWSRHGCNSLNLYPEYSRVSEKIVRGNRFTTVPKDAFKRRGICIEPSINLFYQLGVGGVIRSKLKTWGYDIQKLQPIHRALAKLASVNGLLATIDLSNASDTICKALVKLLLPSEWYELLDSLRSKHTFVNGHWVLLEKFSSMGNGFTFELETLLFLAISLAVKDVYQYLKPDDADETVSVYGDDIIVPTYCASGVISALSFFGLTTNKDKTFISGPFRESCGGDYFKGMDVRPHFLKEEPIEPQQLIVLANGLRRCSKNAYRDCDTRDLYHRAWLSCVDALPTAIRACKGPECLGDIVLHQDESRWIDTRRERSGIHYLRCYRPVRPRRVGWENFKPGVVFASALYGAGDGIGRISEYERKFVDSGGVFPRQSNLLSHRVGWVAQS